MLSAVAGGGLREFVRLSDGLGSRTRSILMPGNAAAITTDVCSVQVYLIYQITGASVDIGKIVNRSFDAPYLMLIDDGWTVKERHCFTGNHSTPTTHKNQMHRKTLI